MGENQPVEENKAVNEAKPSIKITEAGKIDLRKEQKASLARPRLPYTMLAKFFFWQMDMITGSKTTLSKAKLIETLASIPYRAWENRQYSRMTDNYTNDSLVKNAHDIMEWGREAQDNEYWHLIVIKEKMKEDGEKDAWYLFPLIPFFMVWSYQLLSAFVAFFSIKNAFFFNAMFEDHAEHVYAQFVEDHPEWDDQPVKSELAKGYGDYATWGDVFRSVGLDERDHMNNSFAFCGMADRVVKYEGMPTIPKA
jgi:demethoxyubiquinone hydroxylase (CLK1/Coq7/Cat5 family)